MQTKDKTITKELKSWFITFVTHNTRCSERMRKNNVKLGTPVIFSENEEIEITKYILQIKQENNLKILAYNICRDHVHMILVCEESERDKIIRKLKGKSTQLFKQNHNITEELHLWAQKYNHKYVERNKTFENMYTYIVNNRIKHQLAQNKGLQPLVCGITCTIEEAFSQEQYLQQGTKVPCLEE